MALLAAINNAVAEIQSKKSGATSTNKDAASSALLKNSQVNSQVARDLLSIPQSSVADMNDFIDDVSSNDRRQNRVSFQNTPTQDDDLRSIKSEYDYGSKKKFVDVLGNVSIAAKLTRQREMNETAGDAFSVRSRQSNTS